MATHTPVPSLPLDYHPDVGQEVLVALERAARATGLPLAQLELLGQDVQAALGFVTAAEEGDITTFLREVDWDVLRARLNALVVVPA